MNLLVVSENFGPESGISGLRVGTFVKHLPRRGVSTFVLSGAPCAKAEEVSLESVFPELPRGASREHRRAVAQSRVTYLPSRQEPPRLAKRLQQRFPGGAGGGGACSLGIVARKLASAHAFYTCGAFRGWVRQAIHHGERIGQRDRVDAVIATFGSEYWNFEVAHVLGKRLRVPVVLDFRDEWDVFFGGSGRRSLMFPLMHRYVNGCALAVCATDSVAARLRRFWPRVPIVVIHSGFDLQVGSSPYGAGARRQRQAFVLGHLGTFWHNERWPKLFDAAALLATSVPVKVLYRGRNPSDFAAALAYREYPSNVSFDIDSSVPKASWYELIQTADVLIAAVAMGSPGAIPAKILDGIGFSKPLLILGDADPSYLARYLRFCPSPWLIVDSSVTVEAIAEYLREAPSRKVLAPHQRFRYSAHARTGELYKALCAVLG